MSELHQKEKTSVNKDCSCHHFVVAMFSEPELDHRMEAARFVKPIMSVETTEGKMVRFEAVTAGQPQPEVMWFREGRQIHQSPEFQVGAATYSVVQS